MITYQVSQSSLIITITIMMHNSLLSLNRYNENDDILMLSKFFNIELFNIDYLSKITHKSLREDEASLRNGMIILQKHNIRLVAVLNTKIAITNIMEISSNKTFLINGQIFYQITEQYFQHIYLNKTKYFLDFISNKKTAKNLNYNRIVISLSSLLCITIFWDINVVLLVNKILYLLHNLFKFSLLSNIFYKKQMIYFALISQHNQEYPIYSILIPMYKEVAKFKKLLAAIDNLDYPKKYLDVKIILEEDDIPMLRESSLYDIPFYIQTIITPKTSPRTKPKALNYAMNFVRGEYIVVYDAEDEPNPKQLKNIVKEFKSLPEEYICLQSNLNFYNANENILTSCLALEYKIWFTIILKGLNFFNFPMPLGGTSNHFKTMKLYELGLWDSHNVTEDADLGLKIYQLGYKSKIHDSITLEEAPVELKIWFFQRVRWIKGFLQTFFIHTILIKHRNLKCLLVIWFFIGLSIHGFLITPLLLIASFLQLSTTFDYFDINIIIIINIAFVLISGICAFKTMKHIGYFKKIYWLLIIALFPFYFLLHSIASYYALWELVTKPFSWNKTPHGLSKLI